MDPLTQATLGAALPQGVASRERLRLATLCGLLGGLAPDLDVLIRSERDPLLFLEFHRQFTHSLLFIPVGGALVGLLVWSALGRRRRWPLQWVLLFSLLGYATHALLDACTSYGTQLLWPFSNERFAWNNVSIIDPLLTLPLLLMVLWAGWRRARLPALAGLVWVVGYLLLGTAMHDRAVRAGEQLAIERGHRDVSVDAKPSFGNLILWKTVYRFGDRYYVDAVRILGATIRYPGDSIAALDVSLDFPWLDPSSRQAGDIARFAWFSDGYLARHPGDPLRVIDLRYSLLPHQIRPLWGIALDPRAGPDEHVVYWVDRSSGEEDRRQLWQMLLGQATTDPGRGG